MATKDYRSPGVYIEEVPSGPRPIEGVGTAMAAFIGFAPDGVLNTPELVTSWEQYVTKFGALPTAANGNGKPAGTAATAGTSGATAATTASATRTAPRDPHRKGAYLSHAVYGFFNNGGRRCYVVRIEEPAAPVEGTGVDTRVTAPPPLQLRSRSADGTPTLEVTVREGVAGPVTVEVIALPADEAADGAFTVRVRAPDIEEPELYENVAFGRKGVRGVIDALGKSKLVMVKELPAANLSSADRAPIVGTYELQAGAPPTPPTAVAGTRASTRVARIEPKAFIGNVDERSGLEGLHIAEDVTMLSCPDLMSAFERGMIDRVGVKAVQLAMVNHCDTAKDRIAILDPLPGLAPTAAREWREELGADSAFATMYYPWISVMGPDGKAINVPPSGHVAGIWSRSDAERGVHKAPANEVVRGALGPALQITKGEQDILNPAPVQVNCIRSFTGRGTRVWGARTLASDAAWRYINVRRLFNYVEESIELGTQWVVFEPNDPDLWSRVRRDIGAFLMGLWRDGALFGATPQEAFFVKCDAELNPEDVRNRGELIVEVGLAPVKPAEFVVFRFSQKAGTEA